MPQRRAVWLRSTDRACANRVPHIYPLLAVRRIHKRCIGPPGALPSTSLAPSTCLRGRSLNLRQSSYAPNVAIYVPWNTALEALLPALAPVNGDGW